LGRIRQTRKQNFKALVNDASRQGLKERAIPPKRRKPYKTRAVSLGRCLVGSLDGISGMLAVAEGEHFK
jgi:hypothetical protein